MSTFAKTPGGTRGARTPSTSSAPAQWVNRQLSRLIRRRGGRFMGMNILFLRTVGARTGLRRETPLAWYPDGEDAWLIVASAGGSARHPGWYHNIAAHPDRVSVEIGGRTLCVEPEQLHDERRDEAWRGIVAVQPRYGKYDAKTDREIPVIRLTPAAPPAVRP